jgi:hypothetical protein
MHGFEFLRHACVTAIPTVLLVSGVLRWSCTKQCIGRARLHNQLSLFLSTLVYLCVLVLLGSNPGWAALFLAAAATFSLESALWLILEDDLCRT